MKIPKIPWYRGTIIALLIAGVVFSSLEMLVIPYQLTYILERGWNVSGVATITWLITAIAVGGNLLHTRLTVYLGLKRTILSTTAFWLLASSARVWVVWTEGDYLMFLIATVLTAGFGNLANNSLSLQLQEELKGLQITGMAWRIFFSALMIAGFGSLSILWFELGLIFYAGGVALCLFIFILLRKKLIDEAANYEAAPATRRRIKEWVRQDYVRVYCHQTGFLIAVSLVLQLLPVLEGASPAVMAGVVVTVINLVPAAQIILSQVLFHWRPISPWMILGSRFAGLLGLPAIVWGITSGNWWLIWTGAILWGFANTSRPLTRAVIRERGLKRTLHVKASTNAFPGTTWHVAWAIGAGYLLLFDLDGLNAQSQAELALWGLMLPLAITILSTWVGRKWYKIPPRQE